MFSIFHGLFTLFAIGADNAITANENAQRKARAIKNGDLTYYGAKGNEYLVENDKWVWTKKNSKGEDVIADMKTGQVYYNLTEIRKKKREEELKKEGKTVRFKMYNEQDQHYYGKYRQPFGYVDIFSGIPVDQITINGVGFYIRLSDGKILRPADDYNTNNMVGKWSIDEIIEIVNQRQDEIRPELDDHDTFWIRDKFFFKLQYVYLDSNKRVKVYNHFQSSTQWKYIEEDGGLKHRKIYRCKCIKCDNESIVNVNQEPYPSLGDTLIWKCRECDKKTEHTVESLVKEYR